MEKWSGDPAKAIAHNQMMDKFPIDSIVVTAIGCRTKGPFGQAKVYGYSSWAGLPQLKVQIISTGRKTTCLAKNAIRIHESAV